MQQFQWAGAWIDHGALRDAGHRRIAVLQMFGIRAGAPGRTVKSRRPIRIRVVQRRCQRRPGGLRNMFDPGCSIGKLFQFSR
jgi:hypothetical protein